ncbi:MAG TPA: hypothetical protein VIK48_04030 [Candidatus Manganitrophaceae bacterium]
MQDRGQEQRDGKNDLAALWAVGLLLALLLSFIGAAWNPPRYNSVRSGAADPAEAEIEEGQNKRVADALNEGTIQYHPSMEKLVKPRPLLYLFFIDLVKVLLFPAAPVLILVSLIRKTIRQFKEPA